MIESRFNESSLTEVNSCSTLGICIPTFNRANILESGLRHLIAEIAVFDIPIYVSDNASTDATEAVVTKAKILYPRIFYKKCHQNMGMDRNFESALNMATTRYAWMIGDDDRIHKDLLHDILTILHQGSHDALIVNGGMIQDEVGRVRGIASRSFTDAGELLRELGWHMTWISSLILSKSLINSMNFEKFNNSHFSHFGSLFEELARRPAIDIYWLNKCSFFPSAHATFSWDSRVLEIFAKRWVDVVRKLPPTYDEASKSACILAHGSRSGLFSPIGFLNMRAKNTISFPDIRVYEALLRQTSKTNIYLIYIISILPVWLLQITRSIFIKLRNSLYAIQKI